MVNLTPFVGTKNGRNRKIFDVGHSIMLKKKALENWFQLQKLKRFPFVHIISIFKTIPNSFQFFSKKLGDQNFSPGQSLRAAKALDIMKSQSRLNICLFFQL